MSSSSLSAAPPIRVLVVGLGTMGTSHARSYSAIEGFELVGLCTSRAAERHDLEVEFPGLPRYERYDEALATLRPDAVAICTYTEHHATMALQAFAAGAHVFCEKPLADTLEAARRVVDAARSSEKALLIGYILRVHPSWSRFVEIGRTLGKPLVMRMNLNQQSAGSFWEVHKKLMLSTSPIVDCGVHYVDIMCQVTRSRPIAVHAVGARLTDEIAPSMYNYGHLHIVFEDGSVGWYEVGWGPMMSETAHFVKDIIGPNGSVSIVARESTDTTASSADHNTHTRTNALRIHHAARNPEGRFARPDEFLSTEDEPSHQELCEREQRLFLRAIRGEIDLSEHHEAAINSLSIVSAADASVRTGEVVRV
ncbi:Gfo/Idh/MocA family oxidoreductase [Bradyrhizobium liaoningense]|uniref:Gfo/Idh/MocA family protein n=1 Tax=Bradyrhizobium liaoningense TaxID=43992 RepID=UPI001BABF31B|nr:Gfo/Idh/MocA family oxidoreductase [Bradyrhizobium liaoningense]MBR0843440.1 Gfo/Idh/MocA family oxidoreductase [Bradyrhizobium liaoningense]MBR0856842.1 Gfo/Idh/MocA family oxidoreductase [Bradyrhizobium liaoningense]